jgi:hypothetical protein
MEPGAMVQPVLAHAAADGVAEAAVKGLSS